MLKRVLGVVLALLVLAVVVMAIIESKDRVAQPVGVEAPSDSTGAQVLPDSLTTIVH